MSCSVPVRALVTLVATLVPWTLWVATGQSAQQLPDVQALHRFAPPSLPVSPAGLTRSAAGGALIITNPWLNGDRMVARVAPDGRVTPVVTSGLRVAYPAALTPGADGRYYGVRDYPDYDLFRLDEAGAVERLPLQVGTVWTAFPLFTANRNIVGFARPRDQLNEPFRTFFIGPSGQLTEDVFRSFWPLRSIGPGSERYWLDPLAPEILHKDNGVLAVAPPGAGFADVLALGDGSVLAMQRSQSDCQLLRITPGSAETRWQANEAWCGFPQGERRFKEDGAGGALAFTERTLLHVTPAGGVTTVITLPPTSPYRLTDADRLVDGRVWMLSSTGGAYGGGAVLDVTAGAAVVVASFPAGNHEGAWPAGPMVVPGDGFVYGTTRIGGLYGMGTIYRASTDGRRFDVLYTFTGGSDGRHPTGLVATADGAIFGSTAGSGAQFPSTLFRVGRTGALTTVHVLRDAEAGRGASALVVGRDGQLYGHAASGGLHGSGTAFRFTTAGQFTVLHHFGPDDGLPLFPGFGAAPFVEASDGNLYTVLTARCSSVLLSCVLPPTMFRMAPNGVTTRLATIGDLAGRSFRDVELTVEGADGRLYGSANWTTAIAVSLNGTDISLPGDGRARVRPSARVGDRVLGIDAYEINGEATIRVVSISPTAVTPLARVAGGYLDPVLDAPQLVAAADGALYGTVSGQRGFTDAGPGIVFRTIPGPSAPSPVRIFRTR